MSRFAFALALTASLLSARADARETPFRHIVIVVQENRTPDNLFHGLQKYLPTADIADTGVNSKGETITLKPIGLAVDFGLEHGHANFVQMYDGGKMDGADLIPCNGRCPSNPQFHYAQYADVKPYMAIAIDYGFANRMFQTNQGPSFPAHQFIFSGTSQPYAYSPLFAAENPSLSGLWQPSGCEAPYEADVMMIAPDGTENIALYPCFEHQTIADLLDQPPKDPTHPVSWRYYTFFGGSIWTAPNAIRHLCQPTGQPPVCTAPQWSNGNVVTWPAQVLVDIHNHALSDVSWVIPTGQDSDHAGTTDGTGPSWVASIVNAIGSSPYWSDTAVLITWDDWGGWYDHVAPPAAKAYGYYELGFRVPLLVVSPYTPKGYVSQQQHDFGSILRFIEDIFDLGRIPPGNFADARADDLMDFFDFKQSPRAFVPIPTAVPESRFLDRSRPMEPPDDD